MTSGMIFDIKRYAINDGPGIRTAVFMKGCPLRCEWCHNPEGQRGAPQLIFRANRCKSSQACLQACPKVAIAWEGVSITDWESCDQCGKCAEVCFSGAREIVGREMSVDQVMAEIIRDVPFYDQSAGGVTFTGGEPMQQKKFLQEVLQACKRQNIHATIDTSGYTSWTNLRSILPLVDLFLYDIKHMDEETHKRYTSATNKRILDNLQRLSAEKANIIVRIPLIPGVNDDAINIGQCAGFLGSLPHLKGVEIMPYHAIGEAKYQALGMKYMMQDTPTPTQEQIDRAEGLLSGHNLPVIRHPTGRNV